MYVTYTSYVVDALDVWTAGAWVFLGLLAYGLWRVWRGMRLDPYQRLLRLLREQPQSSIVFPRRRPAPSRGTGLLQISLLPLMLVSCGIALLLAQALRPDVISRPVTWSLFVVVATWYGSWAWTRHRSLGPLRNQALAGVTSGAGVSALLWGFYLGVDSWRGEISCERVTACVPGLLWWTVVGGVIGGLIGSSRASRTYSRAWTEPAPQPAGEVDAARLTVTTRPRARRVQWGMIAIACGAGLLFHGSAAPHVHRIVEFRFKPWKWNLNDRHAPPMLLTMTPSSADLDLIGPVTFGLAGRIVPPEPGANVDAGIRNAAVDDLRGAAPDDLILDDLIAVAAPTRDVAVGERITKDLLVIERRAASDVDDHQLMSPRQLHGMYAREPLRAGWPIYANQVARQRGSWGLYAGDLVGLESAARQLFEWHRLQPGGMDVPDLSWLDLIRVETIEMPQLAQPGATIRPLETHQIERSVLEVAEQQIVAQAKALQGQVEGVLKDARRAMAVDPESASQMLKQMLEQVEQSAVLTLQIRSELRARIEACIREAARPVDTAKAGRRRLVTY